MKNSILLLFSVLLIGLTSCSKEETLVVSDADMDFLKSYIDKSNNYASIVGEFDGDANVIFDNVVFSVDCNGGGASITVQQEGQNLLTDLLTYMDFQTPREVHNWVVKAGKVMYDIKRDNPGVFENEVDFATELACMIMPEIRTRNLDNYCQKDNMVQFFRDTHRLGGMYGIRFNKEEDQREVTAVTCQARGSAINKLWDHMKRTYECE